MTHPFDRRLWIRLAFVLGIAVAPAGSPALAQPREGFTADQNVPPAYRLTAFYEPPRDLRRFKPGDVIKTEAVAAPPGARAWRVMYMSTTWDGRPTPVTGLVIAPLGQAAKARPVLAWAHGTTGAARGCAPSLAQNPVREFQARGGINPVDIGVPYLGDFLARGYVVVASDYQGLGGPGRPQYLVGETTARGVLDIVRAAGRLKGTGAGREVSLLGWSQGGHAALFAGEIGATYAPDLKIQGVATLAPSASLMSPLVDKLFRSNTPHVYLIANGYGAAYDLPMTAFTARGRELTKVAGESCVLEVFKQAATSPAPGVDADITGVPGWVPALTRNQAGLRASAAPILIVHGTADSIVAPAGTPFYADRARAAGSQVTVAWIEGGDHRSIMAAGKDQILAWLDARRMAPPTSPPAEVRRSAN
jgi:alpha-beta hydrolase superfamily lysophospholipase